MAIDVRPARKADIPALARVMARAFQDDPVMAWVQPDAARRQAALPGLFSALTRHHFLAGRGTEVAVSEDGVAAAALWDPPGRWMQSPREQLAMLPGVMRAFRGRLAAARTLTDLMKANHPEEPHWYLAMIGSDPTVRGGGFGRALMQSRLDRCDAEYAPAYLESSNPVNIPYYERFGFEVTGEIALPEGGPSLWPMWRAPR
ncbi:ribosomal protein S18 acetylase RimI-like enzyme [Mycolicibacterium sp. BK634]|uniref:GNAT family N-acetyltransferase n=1 Tax=Mycobacteriaceae TaxID=1762 RepID=UPI001061DA69|nr:GNAT family N-acetyltransferase [Mycobacterium sp. BK086]MBB3748644.1 ribosomal protein S18 acetylase RimI-like enzyme [Mycolicibacterium sp. BK634]TDO10437.1 acetyltransferase (GNAT) family protein [Mycobacterium sp. BK086]